MQKAKGFLRLSTQILWSRLQASSHGTVTKLQEYVITNYHLNPGLTALAETLIILATWDFSQAFQDVECLLIIISPTGAGI